MSSTRLFTAFLLLLTKALVACAVPQSEQQLVAFPADGSMALRGDLEVRISVGDEDIERVPQVRVTGAGRTWDVACAVDPGRRSATCEPLADLPAATDLEVSVDLGDGRSLVHRVSTASPSLGAAWLLTDEIVVKSFGGGRDAALLLQQVLSRAHLIGVLAGDHLLVGPVRPTDGHLRIEEPGLGFALPVDRGEEGFQSGVLDSFLPLLVDGEPLFAYVSGCRVVADRVHGDLSYTLTGAFPATTVEEVADRLGALGELLEAELVYDVDTDLDGTPDAVSFSILGLGASATLRGWTGGQAPAGSPGLGGRAGDDPMPPP